jgi:hypothetical protein
MALEALGAQGHPRDADIAEQRRETWCDGLGVRLDRYLIGGGKRAQQSRQRMRLRERRRTPADEHRFEPPGERVVLEFQLGEQGFHVAVVLLAPAHERDEVAVPAAVRAEREVHVEVAGLRGHRFEPSRSSTARKASCGTSTDPSCFIRFFPAFWRSSSLRLRVMSPP